MQPARKKAILVAELGLIYPGRESRPCLLSDLKLHMALDDTRSPCATSRTRSLVKSQARSLLSMARSKRARSRVLSAI